MAGQLIADLDADYSVNVAVPVVSLRFIATTVKTSTATSDSQFHLEVLSACLASPRQWS